MARYCRAMVRTEWRLDESDGELQIHTDVAGRAARMGHRLGIAMTSWRATVSLDDGEPTAADLIVDVSSLDVLRSEGGLKPLSGHEIKIIRRNALKSLRVERFPKIHFHAEKIDKVGDGDYRVTGSLDIHGKRHERVFEFRVEDLGEAWELSGQAEVRQSDFGIKPYSLFGGTLKVVDTVAVTVVLKRAKD